MIPESYHWNYRETDEKTVRKLAQETGFSEKFAALLAARGIGTGQEAERFMNADTKDLYDPMLMKGMAQAVNRICKALARKEKITIYGDYDVDGITATSTLFLFLKDYHANVDYYLPDRMTEGYGLNENAVREIAGNGTQLMITVDTGITAVKEVKIAHECGMEVIITDHHECMDELPEAEVVIDARQPGETYPCKDLAGCGVAFKLACAVADACGYQKDIFRFLELTAVGTVADIVPLTDENRIIVREGFKRLHNPSIMGLRKLLERTGFDFHRKLTSGFVGFGLAPRLNAGGRMGDAARGVRLFTTQDEAEASGIADDLEAENKKRRETEDIILEQVLGKIESDEALKRSYVIVAAGENWHHGVVGIVSSRIKDRYYRPNILLSIEGDTAIGSARSIDGFNLFEALCTCSDLMIKFGGHAAAAGMTLKVENIPELYRRLNDYAREHMDSRLLVPKLEPELSLMPSELTPELIHLIEKMEPFGQSMPEPVIEIEGMLREVRCIGGDGHTLRMRISDRKSTVTAIGFRKYLIADYYCEGQVVSAAGTANLNLYNGREYPQLMIKDVKRRRTPLTVKMSELFSLRHVTGDYRQFCDEMPKLPRKCCNEVYKQLLLLARSQSREGEGFMLLEDLQEVTGKTSADRMFALLQAVCVFEELGLIKAESTGMYMHFQIVSGRTAKLADSSWYQQYFFE